MSRENNLWQVLIRPAWLFTFIFAVSALVIFVSFAFSHPGATDSDGCHTVSKNYKYQSGKVLKAGTEHCHATLNKMKFDGKTVLEDPPTKKEKGKK